MNDFWNGFIGMLMAIWIVLKFVIVFAAGCVITYAIFLCPTFLFPGIAVGWQIVIGIVLYFLAVCIIAGIYEYYHTKKWRKSL